MTDVQDRSLGDLVTANSAVARVLERHGLDYCCNGAERLATRAPAPASMPPP